MRKKSVAQKRAAATAEEENDEEDSGSIKGRGSPCMAAARKLANCPGVEPWLNIHVRVAVAT